MTCAGNSLSAMFRPQYSLQAAEESHAKEVRSALSTDLRAISIFFGLGLGLISTAVWNHTGRPADVWSNANSWVAKPSQAVQYRRN
jgi:hypothetical protein